MTQHDETGTATGRPEPTPAEAAPPSPYLDSGGSVPEAYLAPPQAGQPKYGTPRDLGPGQRQFGPVGQTAGRQTAGRQTAGRQTAGRQAPGPPAYGQSGYQQAGYGRPASARTAFALRRDPALAAPWERLAATVIDWVIIFAIVTLAFISPLERISREMQAVHAHYADLYSPHAQHAVNAILRNPSNERALLFWFVAMFGFALAYYWVQHAAWGATIGKRALGSRVVKATDHSAIGIRAAGIRAVAFLVGPALFWLTPVPFNVAFNIAGGLLWVADTGFPLLDSRAQCLHDKLAGTVVIRQRWLDQQAGPTRSW